MKTISGNWIEGSKVTVEVDGKVVTRRVRWSGRAKDLYVTVDNMEYYFCEFDRAEE